VHDIKLLAEIREDRRYHNMSFPEMNEVAIKMWEKLAPTEKESYEIQAAIQAAAVSKERHAEEPAKNKSTGSLAAATAAMRRMPGIGLLIPNPGPLLSKMNLLVKRNGRGYDEPSFLQHLIVSHWRNDALSMCLSNGVMSHYAFHPCQHSKFCSDMETLSVDICSSATRSLVAVKLRESHVFGS
jgi:hypothetical protein